ncbi:MAG: sugar transferase, partial [Coriobacteriia bacterium]
FFIRFGGQLPAFNFEPYLVLAPVITLIYLLTGYIYGLYEPERIENPWAAVRAAVSSATLGTALTTALLFFAGPGFFSFSRLVILINWGMIGLLLTAWRLIFLRVGRVTWPEQCVLVVGTDALAVELAHEMMARERWGYRVAGLLSCPEEACATTVSGFPVLGTTADIAQVVHQHGVDRVIVVSPVALRDLIESLTLAEETRVRVDVVPELYEIFIGTVDAMVADIPLMEITRTGVPRWFFGAKRIFDVAAALLLLVVLSPVIVLAMIGIAVSMGLPVFFRQERVGQDRRPFTLLKLRTMVREAEADSGPVLAVDDDPRITPLGGFLRTYRIDELPQLINIVRGDMSFVGPRPERPYFVEQHLIEIPGYGERFRSKPGVTGLAQVSGGYATTAERKLKYDLIYMYHQNLSMDLQIVIETLRVVFTGRGAR